MAQLGKKSAPSSSDKPVRRLTVRFAHFLIGSWKRVLLRRFFLLLFVRCLHLEFLSSDELDESDEEESDELASEYRSAGSLDTVLGGLLRDIGLRVGVTLSYSDLYDGDV